MKSHRTAAEILRTLEIRARTVEPANRSISTFPSQETANLFNLLADVAEGKCSRPRGLMRQWARAVHQGKTLGIFEGFEVTDRERAALRQFLLGLEEITPEPPKESRFNRIK